MKSLLVIYWTIIGFIQKHTLLLILSIIIGVGGVVLVPQILGRLPKSTPSKKVAIIGNPTLEEIPLFIQKQVSFGLTQILPNGEATGSAAKDFRVEDDGKRFVFTLRDDLVWHDGKPFTSEDVNYNFADAVIERPEGNIVIFNLKEPFAPFPTVVSQPLFRQSTSRVRGIKTSIYGLGKSTIQKIIYSSQQSQRISEIQVASNSILTTYRFYTTQENAITAFKLGEIDTILELSSPGELARWPNTKVEETVHLDRYVALFFKYDDPYLSSKKLRQALTYAISEKPTGDLRSISPLNPNSWAFNPQVKQYSYDLDIAKKLVEEDKADRDDYDPFIELTTTYPHLETAELIKKEWEDLGIPTSIRIVSYIPEDMQVLLIAQEIPSDPDQYSLWHSTQSANITRYNEPKVDKLLEDGRQITDKNERIKIYQDFQRYLVEDCPAAFLYHHKTYNIHRD